MSEDREAFIRRMIEERDISRTMAVHMWDSRQPNLVECDACPASGGCVEVCTKAPVSAARQVMRPIAEVVNEMEAQDPTAMDEARKWVRGRQVGDTDKESRNG